MVTQANNERLTRVSGDVPLGRMLRENYWIPFARSAGVKLGAAPQRVKLLGRNLVAFRGSDGQVGLLDEHCPHRRVSLALARVEGCSLRCLYHGWRMGATGRVLEIPSEGERSDAFAERIAVNEYQVREAGGLVWGFLGKGAAPELPPLPFLDVPEESRWFSRMIVPCNWLQGFEGALDSAHLSWLHQSWGGDAGKVPVRPPVYEIEHTRYGLRTAAVRAGRDTTHFRVAEFIAPFYAFSASRQPEIPGDCSVFISVPMDDETHMLFFGFWDEHGPLQDVSKHFPEGLDPDNLVQDVMTPENNWGQDRQAMDAGHFSGFTRSVLHEDVAVQVSMTPIVDRSAENLCSTDLAIVRMRRYLLDLIDQFEAGQPVDGDLSAYRDAGHLPYSGVLPTGSDWRRYGQRKTIPAQVHVAAIPAA